MGQANCCAGKGKEDQVDMERARQKEISRQKERERRMSEKKKRESAKQGARIREEVEREEDDKYNPDEIETMLPEKTTVHDVKRNSTYLDYVEKARERLIDFWYDNRSDSWVFKKTENGVDLYSQPCDADTNKYTKRVMEFKGKKDYVANYLTDLSKEQTARYNTDKIEKIEELGDGSYIAYMTTKSSLTLGSRDFCYVVSRYPLKNGDIVIVKHSVDHKDRPKGKNIRGNITEMILIQPTSDINVRVTSVLDLDMKGSVPTSKMTKIVEKQIEEFSTYKTTMDK